MAKRTAASNKRKAATTTSTTTAAPSSSPSTRSSSRTTSTTTTTAAAAAAAAASSTTTSSNNKRKISALKSKDEAAMFGKGKKNKQSNGTNKSQNILEMFQSLVEDPEDANAVITMEGIALLGEKLGIDVTEDIRILVLLWKMDCHDKPGSITLTEWTSGCERLGIDSFDAMMEILPSLELGFMENSDFKDFYKFCFKFNLSGTHRTLPIEVVVELLQLVLKDRDPNERVPAMCKFLQQPDSTYTCITMDQWCSFFDFNIEVGADISNYDESTSAWPVLIDEFVEYLAKADV